MTPPKGPLSAQLLPASLHLLSWELRGGGQEDPTPLGQAPGIHSQQDRNFSALMELSVQQGRKTTEPSTLRKRKSAGRRKQRRRVGF